MVISAAGVLIPQQEVERDVRRAAEMVQANFTGHVTSLLAIAGHMRARGRGTIVVLSSVAAVRPRKANFVYGSAKAGLDSFARGLADSLHGTGVPSRSTFASTCAWSRATASYPALIRSLSSSLALARTHADR